MPGFQGSCSNKCRVSIKRQVSNKRPALLELSEYQPYTSYVIVTPLPCFEVVRRYDEDAVLIISYDCGDDFEDQSRMRI